MIADTKANNAARKWSNFMWCFTLAGAGPQEKLMDLVNFLLDTANESGKALPYKA